MLDLLDCNGKKDIKSMTLEEVTAQMAALGEKSFRAKQLYDWMHVKLAEKFDDMSSLSRELRQKLKENYSLTCLKLVDERVSQVDGTRKYLFGLDAVPPWQFRMHFLPGGLPYGLPFLRVHSGRPGTEPASFRDAGSDIQDPVHHRGTCFQCGGHGVRGAYG